MALLTVKLYGDPVLRQVAAPVREITPEIKRIIADMTETMWHQVGIGLAAPQVGLSPPDHRDGRQQGRGPGPHQPGHRVPERDDSRRGGLPVPSRHLRGRGAEPVDHRLGARRGRQAVRRSRRAGSRREWSSTRWITWTACCSSIACPRSRGTASRRRSRRKASPRRPRTTPSRSSESGLRVLFYGTPAFALPTLEGLLAHHHVVAVITQPDRPAGRGRPLTASPVKRRAGEAGVPVLQPPRLRDPGWPERLAEYRADVAVVAAFGQILPKTVLDVPARGSINVHASVLPRYRGAAPIAWAIIRGETESGITTFQMDPGMDTGRHAAAGGRPPIGPDETAGELSARLAGIGAAAPAPHARGARHPAAASRRTRRRPPWPRGSRRKTAGSDRPSRRATSSTGSAAATRGRAPPCSRRWAAS